MNSFWASIIGAVVRTSIATASGYAVAKGTLDADTATQLGGAAVAVGTGVWSLWQKARAPVVITRAVDAGAVPVIVAPKGRP